MGAINMKKYLLFCGDNYYPNGGWADFKKDFDTLEDALAADRSSDWYQIIDRDTKEVIKYKSN